MSIRTPPLPPNTVRNALLCATSLVVAATTACTHNGSSSVQERPEELNEVLERTMALPQIHAEAGFKARLLIPPGRMYDPLFMRDQGEQVWINDDGGTEGDKGSQILAIARDGKIATVVREGEVMPMTGFDLAPASFAPYVGQIFTVAFPEIGLAGALKSNVIQRIDLKAEPKGEVFCTLPSIGTESPSLSPEARGIAALAVDAIFGPEGSPFAGRFFAVAANNYTVYQATPDRQCSVFVTLNAKQWGIPQGLAFSPDGQHLLVSGYTEQEGIIARVRADGTIEAEPLVHDRRLHMLAGMAYAPQSFGPYAGQLFMSVFQIGGWAIKLTQPIPAQGEVYRLTPAGELKRVASGFHTPQGIHFMGRRLWVSDINGDFIGGRRELPDGFVVEVTPAPQ